MNQVRLIINQAFLIALLVTASHAQDPPADREPAPDAPAVDVHFLDVLEIPARIDGLRLEANGGDLRLSGAFVNRSGEQLLGLRLMLLVFDSSGKLRSRITWSERCTLAGYSIDREGLRPAGLENLKSGDRLVLGLDEVIGRETIWRAAGLEKALKAYARGQHDVIPVVRTIPNKFDSRSPQLPVFPPPKPH
jgi:hypothetical protein